MSNNELNNYEELLALYNGLPEIVHFDDSNYHIDLSWIFSSA